MKSYGCFSVTTAQATSRSASKSVIEVDCEPHVGTKIKRVFSQAHKAQKSVHLSLNGDTAEEFLWFLQRYPMTSIDGAIETIRSVADKSKSIRDVALKILEKGPSEKKLDMAIPARPYQASASEMCHVTGRLLCADELGLGKTCVGISLLARDGTLPAAVIVPTHLTTQWQREIERFIPGTKCYIAKTTDPSKEKIPDDVDVFIVTYSKIYGWSMYLSERIQSSIWDEIHELRKSTSDRYHGAYAVASASKYKLGLTATPIWNYGSEFYSVLGIIDPEALGTWDEFCRAWCTDYTDSRKASFQDPVAFGSWLRDQGLMLRRTRKDVARELPHVIRNVIDVEWDDTPLKEINDLVIELATKVLSASGRDTFQASGDLDARVRQATGIAKSASVSALVKTIIDTSDEPVLLFGWHRAVYSSWLQLLGEFKPVLYTGSETPADKAKSIASFISGESKVLIMSLRSGQGVDGLQDHCRRVVFGELDWSPGAMEQCLGRIHRDGQRDVTMAYYPVCDTGSDPIILDVIKIKQWQSGGVIDPEGLRALNIKIDPDHIKKLARSILLSRGINLEAQSERGPEEDPIFDFA